jgi:ABC-2 type transport system permease protein
MTSPSADRAVPLPVAPAQAALTAASGPKPTDVADAGPARLGTTPPAATGSAWSDQFPPGTFAPDPAPAPARRRITATAGLELRLTVRNGEQLLLALIIPMLALIGGTLITVVSLPEPRINAVVPGVLVLAVLSSAFTSQAITTGFDRRYGVLKRLAAAGVGRAQLIAGKCAATLAVIAGQCIVLGGTALLLGWRPVGNPLWVLLIVLLGAASFIGLALLLGGTLRAEAVLAVANLLWLIFVMVGGIIVPLDQSADALQTVGELTPAGAMSQALRAVLQDGSAPPAASLVILVAWIAVGWAATVRWFKWQ